MKILITGASGFIGRNIADYMTECGHDVYGTYRSRYPEGCKFHAFQCDLSKTLPQSEYYDVVIHLASQIEVRNINSYLDNTVNVTRNLTKYCEMNAIPKIINMSSISVYGECKGIVNENSDKVNLDNYAITKLISEKIVESSDIKSKITLRLPRVLGYGVNYNHQWVPNLVYKLSRNEQVNYYNPDIPYNNLMYIDDLNNFCLKLISNNLEGYECIGLGGKYTIRIFDIIHTLKEYLNSNSILKEKINTKPNTCFAINIEKALQYGYEPTDTYQLLLQFAEDTRKILKID